MLEHIFPTLKLCILQILEHLFPTLKLCILQILEHIFPTLKLCILQMLEHHTEFVLLQFLSLVYLFLFFRYFIFYEHFTENLFCLKFFFLLLWFSFYQLLYLKLICFNIKHHTQLAVNNERAKIKNVPVEDR